MTETLTKTCRRCGEEKRLGAFGINRERKDGRSSYCLPCARSRSKEAHARNREGRLARRRQSYARSPEIPEQYRTRWYKRYNLTPEEYDQILAQQGGVCAICGTEPESERAHGRRLAIDHDHSCCPNTSASCGGCIRGLICASCNTALGRVSDDYRLLLQMAEYVLRGRDVIGSSEIKILVA